MNIAILSREIKNGDILLVSGAGLLTPELEREVRRWLDGRGLQDCLLLFATEKDASLTMIDEGQMHEAGWERMKAV